MPLTRKTHQRPAASSTTSRSSNVMLMASPSLSSACRASVRGFCDPAGFPTSAERSIRRLRGLARAETDSREAVVYGYAERARRPDTADVDPITTEVVRHGLISAAEQMKRALIRTAFNPIIYEVLDFAVAIYDRQVRLLSQALGMQHFMGRLSFGIEASVAAIGGEEKLEAGDILFYNVPYLSGAHANDAAVLMPVFVEGELVGYTAITAHWLDVGGKDPYSTDTVDVFQEGTLFPGVKLYKRGGRDDDLYRTLLA